MFIFSAFISIDRPNDSSKMKAWEKSNWENTDIHITLKRAPCWNTMCGYLPSSHPTVGPLSLKLWRFDHVSGILALLITWGHFENMVLLCKLIHSVQIRKIWNGKWKNFVFSTVLVLQMHLNLYFIYFYFWNLLQKKFKVTSFGIIYICI